MALVLLCRRASGRAFKKGVHRNGRAQMLRKSLLKKNIILSLSIFTLSACGAGTSVEVAGDDPIEAFLAAQSEQGEDFDPDKPLIVLNKPDGLSPNVEAEVFEPIGEPGFQAVDLRDGDISSQVEVINLVPEECQSIDDRDVDLDCLAQEGFRRIYSVINSRGKQTTTARIYNFRDSASPQISFSDNFPASVERTFDLPSFGEFVSASDNYDLSAIQVSLLNPSASTDSVGDLALQFQASDSSGNIKITQKTISVIDTIAPSLSIASPVANFRTQSQIMVQGSCESSPGNGPVLIEGDIASSVEVNCNAGSFSSPVSLSGAEGPKAITASQRDQSDNLGSSIPRVFYKDITGPNLGVSSPTDGDSFQTSFDLVGTCESFEGSPAYPNSSIRVTGAGIEGGPYEVNCSISAYSIDDIPLTEGQGTKEVLVTQSDFAGNQKQISLIVFRDEEGPNVVINLPQSNEPYRDIPGTSNDVHVAGSCESSAGSVIVRLEQGGQVKDTVLETCSGNQFQTSPSRIDLSDVVEGTATITATQTDFAGNPGSDSVNIIVDNTGPVLSLDDLPEFVSETSLSLSGDCEPTDVPGSSFDNENVKISGNLAGSSNDEVACSAAGRYEITVTLSSGQGTKDIFVNQKDYAGNSAATQTDSVIFDSQAPQVTINSPAENKPVMSAALIDVSGNCGSSDGQVSVGIDFEDESLVNCSAGSFNSNVTIPAGNDGDLIPITASQTDLAGLLGSDTQNVLLDNTAPVLQLGDLGGTVGGTSLNVVGTCDTNTEAGLFDNGLVVLSGDFTESPLSVVCDDGFSGSITLTSGDGQKNVTANQMDHAGNAAVPSEMSVILDTSGPDNLSILSPQANQPFQTGAMINVKGDCDETAEDVRVSIEGVSGETPAACSVYQTSGIDVQLSAAGGPSVLITAKQADTVGNEVTRSLSVSRDDNISLSIAALPDPVTSLQVAITGACESSEGVFGAEMVQVTGADVSDFSFSCPASGTFNETLTVEAADGEGRSFSLSQSDFAGNTDNIEVVFNYNGQAPIITVTYFKNGDLQSEYEASGSPHALPSEELCSDLEFSAQTDDGSPVDLSLRLNDSEQLPADSDWVSKTVGDLLLTYTASDGVNEADPVSLEIQIESFARSDFDLGFKEPADWEALADSSALRSKRIVLCNTINFAGEVAARVPGNFSGILDGMGPDGQVKSLENFRMQRSNAAALFQRIGEGAIVRNLSLREFHIQSDGDDAAALAVESYGRLERIKVHGPLFAGMAEHISAADKAAGLVAKLRGGEASEIAIDGIIAVGGNSESGGIVAEIDSAILKNSYSLGVSVTGNRDVGGLSGSLEGAGALIQNSYSLFSNLSGGSGGSDFTRSLVGMSSTSIPGDVQASFYDLSAAYVDDAGTDPLLYGSGMTYQDFSDQVLLSGTHGWDFDLIWSMDPEYPILQFEMAIE